MQHSVDQRQMGERLRVVAQVAPALGIELLGVEVQGRGVGSSVAGRKRTSGISSVEASSASVS